MPSLRELLARSDQAVHAATHKRPIEELEAESGIHTDESGESVALSGLQDTDSLSATEVPPLPPVAEGSARDLMVLVHELAEALRETHHFNWVEAQVASFAPPEELVTRCGRLMARYAIATSRLSWEWIETRRQALAVNDAAHAALWGGFGSGGDELLTVDPEDYRLRMRVLADRARLIETFLGRESARRASRVERRDPVVGGGRSELTASTRSAQVGAVSAARSHAARIPAARGSHGTGHSGSEVDAGSPTGSSSRVSVADSP